jgi:predicted MPP superfamily phosphohydrolase
VPRPAAETRPSPSPRARKPPWKLARRLALALSILGLGLWAWAFGVEPGRLTVHEERLGLPGWPAPLSGMRVAVLADLHVGSPFIDLRQLERIVQRTTAAHPDLVLIAGDLMIHDVRGGRRVPPEAIAPILGRLRAPLGVYAVLGNHDIWFDPRRVARSLEAAGIPVLDDVNLPLAFRGGHFRLAGISDLWAGRHDIAKALTGIPAGEPILALTHNPDLFPEVPARVSLTVAGHTHGGQVALPWLGRLVVPSRFGQRYAIGHVVEGGRHLYVSPGVGTSILPVRFRVPPEITILRLEARKRGQGLGGR